MELIIEPFELDAQGYRHLSLHVVVRQLAHDVARRQLHKQLFENVEVAPQHDARVVGIHSGGCVAAHRVVRLFRREGDGHV